MTTAPQSNPVGSNDASLGTLMGKLADVLAAFSQQQTTVDAPQVRLHVPDEQTRKGTKQTLSQVFESWYVPIVLIGQRNASTNSVREWRTTIDWWIKLTGDPPLDLVDDYLVAQFVTGLRSATWSRSKLGPKNKRLSEFTQYKHLKGVRSLLMACGPIVDPRRTSKNVIERVPLVVAKKPHARRKPALAMETARSIVAAAKNVNVPNWPGISAVAWWRALLALLFYTGLRIGTVLRLRWHWVTKRPDGWWLEVPASAVPKTHKPVERPLHDLVVQSLEAIRGHSELLVPWPHCYEHLRRVHESLQAAAGIPSSEWLSPHAWRRTHGQEMARLGSRFGLQLAQFSLDHADPRTTSDFYVDIASDLMRRLPPLWDDVAVVSAPPLRACDKPVTLPSSDLRLTDVFEKWFVPVVLVGERHSKPRTIYEYRRSLEHWVATTGNPAIQRIDADVIGRFVAGVRGGHGDKPLNPKTARKYTLLLQSILSRCGQTTDPSRPGYGLLAIVPRIPVYFRSGPRFSLEKARLMVAASSVFAEPNDYGVPAGAWWRCLFALLFYTGLPFGTIITLQWSWVSQQNKRHWLTIPKTANSGPVCVPLHPLAFQAATTIKGRGGELLPFRDKLEDVTAWHRDIQESIGVRKNDRRDLRAWRSTHHAEMAKVAARIGTRLANGDDVDAVAFSGLAYELPGLWD